MPPAARARRPASSAARWARPVGVWAGALGELGNYGNFLGVGAAGAGADRRAERHHGGAADALETAGEDRVIVGVREDREAVADELLGGRDELDRIGEERAVVADHLELDPVGPEGLAG